MSKYDWADNKYLQGMIVTRIKQTGYMEGDNSEAAELVREMYRQEISELQAELASHERRRQSA